MEEVQEVRVVHPVTAVAAAENLRESKRWVSLE